jgi:hypothetical protein
MQKRKKTSTHENPQTMSSKKQNSILSCVKQDIPNHPEKNNVSRKTKRLETK